MLDCTFTLVQNFVLTVVHIIIILGLMHHHPEYGVGLHINSGAKLPHDSDTTYLHYEVITFSS